ncbi:MAG: NB-ARC domain-containing protein, partial [Cyanobacteria bacterium P01_E01_bin.45]
MADSVQASEAGLERIDRARRRKHWNKTAETWCRKAFTSRATLNRFWAQQPIRREAFIAICSAVEVDWETVAQEDSAIGDRPTELLEVTALEKQLSSSVRTAASPVNFAALAAPMPANFIPVTESIASLYLNENSHTSSASGVVDWGDAPAVSAFCGRSLELDTLTRWIVTDRCRSVALLGMGGMGKTTLAAKLAHTVHHQFSSLVWRSLRNAPPVGEMLVDLIQVLSCQHVEDIAERLDGKIRQLIGYLRQSRCLLVLDNVESILQGGDRSGGYQPQYEGYGQLFRAIWETEHQSCALLTSREPPSGLVLRDGDGCPVRSFNVLGVSSSDSRTICNIKGTFSGTEQDWHQFTDRFGGNPLALQLAAATIRDFFAGSLTQFLQLEERENVLFDDINTLLQQQFQRLPPLEKAVMIWLAIAREPITLAELDTDCLCHRSTSELMQALVSLQRRSLVEANEGRFTQQPVLMEFVTRYVVEQVCEEILDQRAELFCTHALVKAQANDYIRDRQVAMILAPISARLLERLGSAKALEVHLRPVLDDVRASVDSAPVPLPEVSGAPSGVFASGQYPKARDRQANQTGYVCSNAIALLKHLQRPLTGYDFSHLTVWQANLRDIDLHGVNFSHADLSDSLFTELLGLTLTIAYSPDGSLFATAGANGGIHLWAGKTENSPAGLGQKLGTLSGHDGWIWSLAFSPDGTTLASGSEDGTVALWNVERQHQTAVLNGQCSQIWAVAFSPDGQTLACGCEDGSVNLWDITTETCVAELNGQCQWIRSIAFSPDGAMLACAGDASAIVLWDVSAQTRLRSLEGHTIDRIWAIAFTPDGQRLASSCSDRTVRVWDVSTGDCLHVLEGHANWVRSLAISPLGDVIASGSEDHTIKVWDIDSGQCLKTLRGHSNWVRAIAFSPDGQLLVSGSGDHTVRLWTVSSGFCQKTLQGYTSRVWSVAFAPDGKTLASSHD